MTQETLTYEGFKQAHYKARGERVKLAMHQKAKNGGQPGPAPLGYATNRNHEGMSVEIDELVAPLIRKTFDMAAKGDMPLRKILREVTEAGLRSKNGKPLGVSALWNILTSPFYAGIIRCEDEQVPGKHPALVDKKTFERVQKGLFRRKKLLDK